ncbi:DUF3153 domain-containing protein [Ancylothrix sp. C2]|uniref:DUF3153 domain-containing protein n=1 Tax=Ancylothrix sp. D3o TaxID=2953691 RepID=UPI0021BB33CD|nr:DUF3153 domain-containing protein [Ancylothrix sp. D3o]MCT7949311.1 DUF3153 domain-containing protein [Ancylothrix sp. D3o]
MKHLHKIFSKLRIFWTIILASCLLSGCVDYDVAINFESQTHGEIVQHIQLGQQFTNFSGTTVQEWLDSIKQRASQLGGRTKQLQEGEILVTIPFNNGAELEEKFNDFFNPLEKKKARPVPDLPDIKSHLSVTQSNWILAIRNQLVYDLDLRSLSVIAANGNVLLSPGSILDLDFSLNTPWGATNVETGLETLVTEKQNSQLTWKLKSGEVNHLETVFWVPSPIGIGALVIILLVALGSFLKYRLLPALGIGKRQAAV